jgi:hypothetical protein
MSFKVGDLVHSRKVGVRAAFDGEVVEVRESVKDFPETYDVKDSAGEAWNRTTADLQHIESPR